MTPRLLFLALFALCLTGSYGQDAQPEPCGTAPFRSEWLQRYQQRPLADRLGRDDTTVLYVPLTIHLLGTDGGNGFFTYRQLMNALHTLQNDFVPANIQFFIEGDIKLVANSAWNSHSTIKEGYEMMVANNIENTINCYIVSDPAGNCGYNLPYADIAVRKSCAGPLDHTWAHEIGHQLSLPHPFLGWEGGVSYDGSVPHNFANPAPDTVLYDYTSFQSQPFFDTLIVDTALVERVDGSNCQDAADGFCDTPPDYQAGRWNCISGNVSPVEQTDPTGEKFRSDGTLIMGYANDQCQNRFTSEQVAAMRANLTEKKPSYLYNQTPPMAMTELPINPLTPVQDETVSPQSVTFTWDSVGHADGYIFELSLLPNFASVVSEEHLVWGKAEIVINDLVPERAYYWRVKPFSRYEFGADYSETKSFMTGMPTRVTQIIMENGFFISPQPVAAGGRLQLEVEQSLGAANLNLQWHDLSGRQIASSQLALAGMGNYSIEVPGLPAGIYLLRMQWDHYVHTAKVVIR